MSQEKMKRRLAYKKDAARVVVHPYVSHCIARRIVKFYPVEIVFLDFIYCGRGYVFLVGAPHSYRYSVSA